ncbi:MAG: FAD binding domain-containing protein [Clostridiaceae bacterium]|nr:FAD binding domain-containing protein [Eubacteriales bacterium]
MIPFSFEYHRPASVSEAVSLYAALEAAGKAPVYYAGGSELLSMARANSLRFGAAIDIKAIPEARGVEQGGEGIVFGAAASLSEVIRSNAFPLLSKLAARVADHTMQERITLGGNLMGTIVYREAALAFLLAQSDVVYADAEGAHTAAFSSLFHGRLTLPAAALLLRVRAARADAQLPYLHAKKTKYEKIDYPLLTLAGVGREGGMHIALSGYAAYPFCSAALDAALNDCGKSAEERARSAADAVKELAQSDLSGSAGYRRFALYTALLSALEREEPCFR